MSLKKCCIVPNCDSYNLPTYGFPRFAEDRAKWASAIGLRPESVGTFARICLKHFKEDDFVKLSKRLTLRHDAVPFIEASDKKSTEDDDWFEIEDRKKGKNNKKKQQRSVGGKIVKEKLKSHKNVQSKVVKPKVKITKATKFAVSPRNSIPLPEKVVETPDVQNTTVIDKDYYFVLINKHKKDMTVESSTKVEETPKKPSQPQDVVYYSLKDILTEAMKISSSVDFSTETNAELEGLKMPDCFNPDCRQLAGRVFLLKKEKEKLQKVYDDLKREVDALENNNCTKLETKETETNVTTTKKPICPSCVNGKLSNLYKVNAIRINNMKQKLNEIRRENIILRRELNALQLLVTGNEKQEEVEEEEEDNNEESTSDDDVEDMTTEADDDNITEEDNN